MTMCTKTLADLIVSPLNVRTNREDAEATDALEGSILAYGLMYPLVIHPLTAEQRADADGAATDGVLAGGRRFRAIGRLIARGDLPADWPIDCVIRDIPPEQITELSLSENLLRRELRPYEVNAAIARAAEQGASTEDIASRTGQRLSWIRQQLRLGTLAPEIFQAYSDEKLSVDHAQAYAATADHTLQLAAWKHFRTRPDYQRKPSDIRGFYKLGDRELGRLLRFVGSDAYQAAGGGFELDLFADENRVIDEGILRQLVEAKLGTIQEEIRAKTWRRDLRFAAEPPQISGTYDHSLEIAPETKGKRKIILPAGDVLATLTIDNDGKAQARYWWASRKAKSAAAREAAAARAKGQEAPVAAPSEPVRSAGGVPIPDDAGLHDTWNYAQVARQAVKEEHGFTADGLQVVRSLRRTLLRAVLVGDASAGGRLGRDYLVWSLLRQQLGDSRSSGTGTRDLVGEGFGAESEPRALVRGFLADEPAHAAWEDTVAEVAALPFMQASDPAESLSLFVEMGAYEKNVAAAVLAGLSLLRSANAQGWRIPAHDKLAQLAGANDAELRGICPPTAAFIGLLPKLKRLELAQPHVGAAEFRSWHKLPDKTLTGACAGALEHADGWLHPLLSFNVGPDDDEIPPGEQDPGVNDTAAEPEEAPLAFPSRAERQAARGAQTVRQRGAA